ncbi:hypothetical protein [Streptomyces sp. NPDC007063]|uniref:hypothetical protein n=1 Tax=Streptomyces sp. NPDC007063 TaxID=3364772 RepID=UPI0036B7AE5F
MPTPSPTSSTSPASPPSPPSPPPPPSSPPFTPSRPADGDPRSAGGTGSSGSGSGGSDDGRATCQCDNCPHSARQSYRKALAAFVQRRDELAAGLGVPVGLAHSVGASRQWVSDELTGAARALADRSREEGEAWVARLWRRTVGTVWAAAGLLLLVQLLTALAGGWSTGRTAGLVAAGVSAVGLSVAAWLHRPRGGVLAPVIGEDNRLSTSRTVAASWVLLSVFAVLVLAVELAAAPTSGDRRALLTGLDLSRGAGVVTVLALTCAVAVVVRRTVAVRVQGRRLQKVRADRPHAADLLTDDAGRGAFSDVQYVLINGVAVVFAAVRLSRQPERLPDLPWGLALLVVVSAATYLAGKYAEGGRPVVLSVVRAREMGDLHSPIRTGDDIEIRGAGFVPPGATAPDRLARVVVRIGAVHVHAPLIPVTGGFAGPADTALNVPVPAEVEPGRVEVQVVTAAGAETNRYPIDVVE